MVPELRLIVGSVVALGTDGGGGIKWFPWLPLLVVGIGLGITGVVLRKDDPEHDPEQGARDDDTGESPVVHRPPPSGGRLDGEDRKRAHSAASAAVAVARILSKAYRCACQTTADRTTPRTSIRSASQCTRRRRAASPGLRARGQGGVPLLLVHGWPETKRIWWRVIEPLAAAGFEVIVPDLRGFGDSDVGPTASTTCPRTAATCTRSCTTTSATSGVVLCRRRPRRSGHPGHVACGFPRWVDADGAVQLAAALRQGADGRDARHARPPRRATTSSARAPTPTGSRPSSTRPSKRRRYIATFYTSRFWAHPGAFTAAASSGRFGGERRRSTSTPSPSPTAPSCARSSAATRARSPGRRAASRTMMATPNADAMPHLVRHRPTT